MADYAKYFEPACEVEDGINELVYTAIARGAALGIKRDRKYIQRQNEILCQKNRLKFEANKKAKLRIKLTIIELLLVCVLLSLIPEIVRITISQPSVLWRILFAVFSAALAVISLLGFRSVSCNATNRRLTKKFKLAILKEVDVSELCVSEINDCIEAGFSDAFKDPQLIIDISYDENKKEMRALQEADLNE